MLIPLGILASAGGVPPIVSDYELISSTILGSNQASISFDVSTYASTYKHLQIRTTARQSGAFTVLGMRMRLGTPTIDTGSNYAEHFLGGRNGSVTSYGGANTNTFDVGYSPAANAGAGIFGPNVIDILDPFSTTKNTTVRSLGGLNAGSGSDSAVVLWSGHWRNTGAVQTIQINPAAGNFVTGSRFSIYGVK
jgi:hypothetical protein